MTLDASHLGEQRLTTLNVLVVQVTSGRNGKTTMPYHELVVLLVGHLLLTTIVVIVQKVFLKSILEGNAGCVQHLIDTCSDALIRSISIVGMQDAAGAGTVLLDVGDDLSILTLSLSPSGGGVEPVAVGTSHIGDIPDSVGTSTVLQRATGHGVSELLHRTMCAILRACVVITGFIIGGSSEIVGFLVPHCRIQFHIGSLFAILLTHVIITDGINQASTVDANGGLQTHLIICR